MKVNFVDKTLLVSVAAAFHLDSAVETFSGAVADAQNDRIEQVSAGCCEIPPGRQRRVAEPPSGKAIGRLRKSETKNSLDTLCDLKEERRRKFLGNRYKVTVDTHRELIRPIKGASSYSQSIKSDSPVSIWLST